MIALVDAFRLSIPGALERRPDHPDSTAAARTTVSRVRCRTGPRPGADAVGGSLVTALVTEAAGGGPQVPSGPTASWSKSHGTARGDRSPGTTCASGCATGRCWSSCTRRAFARPRFAGSTAELSEHECNAPPRNPSCSRSRPPRPGDGDEAAFHAPWLVALFHPFPFPLEDGL